MACCNNSTSNCGTTNNESLPISLNTRDSRKKTIATTEAGSKWGKGRGRQIEIKANGTQFCHWETVTNDDSTTSTLCAFAIDEGNQKFQFVRCNSDQDGLELSSPKSLPDSINANDPRLFKLTTSFRSTDSEKILHHCQSGKFVTLNNDDELELHCDKQMAGLAYIADS